jgi:hypothetical protein
MVTMNRGVMRSTARGFAAVAAFVAVMALAAPGAGARERTVHLRYGPVHLNPAELKFGLQRTPAPRLRGFITQMHAVVIDRRGRPLRSDRVMLHHAVFRRRIKPSQYDSVCRAKRDSEPFYGTGEEDETLRLPAGYGLSLRSKQRWLLRWMLMNHTNRSVDAYIRYDVRIEDSRRLTPVIPLWHRVVQCGEQGFNVPGGGGPGGLFTKSRFQTIPVSGRIVTATGHLHGGAQALTLSQPRCGGRPIVVSRPVYQGQGSVPAPHDGPVSVTSYASLTGIPVVAGEPLLLTATYDNSVPREEVMGTMHIYLAPEQTPRDCGPLPGDARTAGAEPR